MTYRSDSAEKLFLKLRGRNCCPQHSGRTALDFFIANAKEKIQTLQINGAIKVVISFYDQQGMKRAWCNQLNVQSAHGNEVDHGRLTPCQGDTEHIQSPTTLCVEDVLITATAAESELLYPLKTSSM